MKICGIDEAGRGPLAGPVYAAAVILDPERRINGLRDSKMLTHERRTALRGRIQQKALAWSIAFATVEEIDRLNILQATLLAMQRAVAGLPFMPDEAWVDGNRPPSLSMPVKTIVSGDRLHPCISAASILAKTARDAEMVRLHAIYPQYGLDRHKGYSTAEHLAAIKVHGVCEIYRHSFLPVRLAAVK
jgi:ribonuclease HII